MDYLPGLDEYYQPPDPPQAVPGDITFAQHIALITFLRWYDDLRDYDEILEAILNGDEKLFGWREEFGELEPTEVIYKIQILVSQINKYAVQIYKESK